MHLQFHLTVKLIWKWCHHSTGGQQKHAWQNKSNGHNKAAQSVSVQTRCMFWYFFPHLWCFSCGVCVHAERRGHRFTGSPVSYLPSPTKSLQTARSSALLPPCMGEIHTPPRLDVPLQAFHHLFLIPEIPPLCHNMGPTCLSFWTSLRRRLKLVTRGAMSRGAMAPRFSAHSPRFLSLFSIEPSRVLLCLQKSAGSDRKPPFSLLLSLCTSLEVEKAKQTSPIRLGEDRNVYMLVCRKR